LCIPEKAGRPHGRAVRCRWQGFSSHLPPQAKKIYATGGFTYISKNIREWGNYPFPLWPKRSEFQGFSKAWKRVG